MKEKLLDKCIFFNKFGIQPDPNPCGGHLTRHHVIYNSENGNGDKGNLVPMCMNHQKFVHSKNIWGGEKVLNGHYIEMELGKEYNIVGVKNVRHM